LALWLILAPNSSVSEREVLVGEEGPDGPLGRTGVAASTITSKRGFGINQDRGKFPKKEKPFFCFFFLAFLLLIFFFSFRKNQKILFWVSQKKKKKKRKMTAATVVAGMRQVWRKLHHPQHLKEKTYIS
jgi:hypothetical protein